MAAADLGMTIVGDASYGWALVPRTTAIQVSALDPSMCYAARRFRLRMAVAVGGGIPG